MNRIEKEVSNLRRAIGRTDDDEQARDLEADHKAALDRRTKAQKERDDLVAQKQKLEANTAEAINQRLKDVDDLITRRDALEGDALRDLNLRLRSKLQAVIKRIEITSRGTPQEASVMVAFHGYGAIMLLLDAKGRVRLVEEGGDEPFICRIDAKGNVVEQRERQFKVDAIVAQGLRRRGINPQNLV